jgi:4,5-DOPA dioxygenase extradiol
MPGRQSEKYPGLIPVLFVGHGSPMNAIKDNTWSRGFRALAKLLPRPKAILAVSAHWYVSGIFVTGNEHPRTIHDFSGFPPELYKIQYPAPGNLALTENFVKLLGSDAATSETWGIDHGTWSVLRHIFPEADIPVIQLSIDKRLPPSEYLKLGQRLSKLREQGILVMGSGNIVHNLSDAFARYSRDDLSTPSWASEFDESIATAIDSHDNKSLTSLIESQNGRMAHPTLDHYLPLLYVSGASSNDDPIKFPITGFDMGSLSMRAVIWG